MQDVPNFEDLSDVMEILIKSEKPSDILQKMQELKDGGKLKLSDNDMEKFAT